MSKTRYIKTDFWSDSFIESLEPKEKLLFIYLFSNEKVELCGTYELSLKKMSFETGISHKEVEDILIKFAKAGKVFYIEGGYVHVRNFTKHLQINPSVQLGIDRSYNALPKPIQEAVTRLGTGCIQEGTLILIPIPIPIPILIPKLKPNIAKAIQKSEDFLDSDLGSGKNEPKESYGREDINKTLAYILKVVGCDTFAESTKMQRIYGKHMLELGKKIGIEEFNLRLKNILSDDFKSKNSNKIIYLYKEIKSYIHSPVVPTEKEWKPEIV